MRVGEADNRRPADPNDNAAAVLGGSALIPALPPSVRHMKYGMLDLEFPPSNNEISPVGKMAPPEQCTALVGIGENKC